jgi:GNAT superfamily N-acetyltransferase
MAIDPSIEIRKLTAPRDELELVSLLWHKGSPWVEGIVRRIRGSVPAADDRFWAAFHRDQIVATAWYTTSRKTPQMGLIGHIYTRPEYRRQGISTELVRAALADFRTRGGSVMQLFSSTPYTIPLYKRFGFENVYAGRSYHETDWYMRYPADARRQIDAWYAEPCREIRPLDEGDLPSYCLLYNHEHRSVLKDWAQSIGLGLEAEFAFINSSAKMATGQGVCRVMDNGRTIVGLASLMRCDFPHHAHVAAFDVYVHPAHATVAAPLIDACLACREDLGAEFIDALTLTPEKRDELARFGFRTQAVLPRHYRVGRQYFDCEWLVRSEPGSA